MCVPIVNSLFKHPLHRSLDIHDSKYYISFIFTEVNTVKRMKTHRLLSLRKLVFLAN